MTNNKKLDEAWKEIPGNCFYQASNMGRIKSLPHNTTSGKILKANCNGTGNYPRVVISLNGKRVTRTVHKLVMLAFKGPPQKGQQVRHLNGIRKDNRLENLAYGSALENQHDRIAHKTMQYGACHPSSKLTWEQAKYIRENYCPDRYQENNSWGLARKFNVSSDAILLIVKGKSYKKDQDPNIKKYESGE